MSGKLKKKCAAVRNIEFISKQPRIVCLYIFVNEVFLLTYSFFKINISLVALEVKRA